MSFITDIPLSDFFTGISLLLVVMSGMFACYKWCCDVALKRASYINELTGKIRTDLDISDTLYMLDYDRSWYSPAFHSGGPLEFKMDRTLSYFAYICYLRKHRIISDNEFVFFEYHLERILRNQGVRDYLYNLYHFTKKANLILSHQYLFEYGKKNSFFDPDFFDSTAHRTNPNYHRYLNF